MGRVFVGHDWAEAHHDVHIEDGEGRRLERARLVEGIEGVARFHELVAAHVEDPAEVIVATETDRGLFVAALVAAGYTVLAVNPMSTSRYRERHTTSGAKSDPGDAKVLAELAPEAFPGVTGLISPMAMLIQSSAAPLAGLLYDLQGTYLTIMIVSWVAVSVGLAAMLFCLPPKSPGSAKSCS